MGLRTEPRRNSFRSAHFDILWLPRAAFRSVESADTSPSDCVLVVGVSRPRIALAVLILLAFSLCLTFSALYDSAVEHQRAVVWLRRKEIPSPSSGKVIRRSGMMGRELEKIEENRGGEGNALEEEDTWEGDGDGSDWVDDKFAERNGVNLFSRKMFPVAARRLPQAIIVGVRKCGTRALLEMLYLHPMVQKAAGEVHFFDRDENYNRGLEWYRSKMPHSYNGQITIEKSPSYFVTAEVPERIRAMNASVKLLLIVREPVTRAISDYTQLRAHAATAYPSLLFPTSPISIGGGRDGINSSNSSRNTDTPSIVQLQPVQQQKTFEQLALHPNGTINESYRPLAISVYHTYVHRWLETFPRRQILVVNGDALIEDPLPQLQKIEKFLGIPARLAAHNFYFNETKGFYCLRNETSDRCLKETKGRRHPRVDPFVITKLRRYFIEHNQKFYELIGEDLGWPED